MSTDKPPQNYDELKKALEKLFGEWREAVSEDLRNKFGEDGAFPGYFKKEPKILFVGWEAYGCEGLWDSKICTCRYWDDYKKKNLKYPCEGRKLMSYFLADKGAIKGQKRPKIAQLAAKITYGIQNRIPDWQEIPNYPAGVSFAFMDVSKYANPKGRKTSENFLRYVKESLGANKSGRNFTREEIKLLNPDLIITWNLKAKLAEEEDKKDKKEKKEKKDKDEVFRKLFTESPDGPKKLDLDNSCGFLANRAWVYKFDDGREIPLLDTWHFSAPFKKHKECFYDPIREAVKYLKKTGRLKTKQD